MTKKMIDTQLFLIFYTHFASYAKQRELGNGKGSRNT